MVVSGDLTGVLFAQTNSLTIMASGESSRCSGTLSLEPSSISKFAG